MILINLLPDEYRQKRRTPIKLLLAVSASVAVNGTLAAYWAWTAFGVAAEVKSELGVLQDQKAGIDPQVAYHRDLEKESELFSAREDMLKTITANRISWTRKVDELIDVVNVGGDGEKYLIWLDDLSIDQKENTRAKSYGALKASGHSGSPPRTWPTSTTWALAFSGLPQPAPPGLASSKAEGLMPAEVWNFPLEVALKAPDERRRGPDGKLLPVQEKPKAEKTDKKGSKAKADGRAGK
jgi:hypothetical protein